MQSTPTGPVITGTWKINRELVADYADPASPYRFLRLHLDVPIGDIADWDELQQAFSTATAPDLKRAHTRVVKIVKGGPAEQGPARRVIDAAFEP